MEYALTSSYGLDWLGAKLARKGNKLGTSFAWHGPPLGGRVITLQVTTCDASLLETIEGPQPRAWTEIHAVPYINMICRHATPAESYARACKPTHMACKLSRKADLHFHWKWYVPCCCCSSLLDRFTPIPKDHLVTLCKGIAIPFGALLQCT
jgi:hypothetical protein